MTRLLSLIMCIMLFPAAGMVSACGLSLSSETEVVFEESGKVSSAFDGIGIDWGVYEDTNKLAVGAWDKTLAAVKRLNPSLVRCMTNLDWIVYDYDDKGSVDLTDDEWKYNFSNKQMKNTCDILDYCQDNGIKVAFGVWNVIGSPDEDVDVWGMIKRSTADPRWPILCADLVEFLVKDKGYTCIKWFVNTNEPNYVGNVGSSKNAYNTYEKWKEGVTNVKEEFVRRDLGYIDIIGGDVTASGTGFSTYLMGVAREMTDIVHNYGVHLYVSNYLIDTGSFYTDLKKNYDAIKEIDKKVGDEHRFIIWESGLLDGKNAVTDCNSYIANYSYGLRMADFTVQSLLAGANGICYWDLDNAMHFMYNENGMTPKEWGMFSTLSGASPLKQELRPWYHSSTLITNMLKAGSTIYKGSFIENDKFRTLAAVTEDGNCGGIIAVNRDMNPVTKTFTVEKKINGSGKLYIYVFGEKHLQLGSDGTVVPNAVVDGDLNGKVTVEIPAGCVTFISSEKL